MSQTAETLQEQRPLTIYVAGGGAITRGYKTQLWHALYDHASCGYYKSPVSAFRALSSEMLREASSLADILDCQRSIAKAIHEVLQRCPECGYSEGEQS